MKIWITGGSKGLGKCLAHLFAKESNNDIFATYNKSDPDKEGLNNLTYYKVDFSDQNELDQFLEQLSKIGINVLINNFHPGYNQLHAHKLNTDNLKEGFSGYVVPTIKITNHVISLFRKKKSGVIINILSAYTLNDSPLGLAQYVAEKKYLEAFNKYWHKENYQFNIASVAVSPGFMLTDFNQNVDSRIIEMMKKKNEITDIASVLNQVSSIIKNPLDHSGQNIHVK